MPSLSHYRVGSSSSADLLPWVDPYITQLFAEAELVELAASRQGANVARSPWHQGADARSLLHQGADAPRSPHGTPARFAPDERDFNPPTRAVSFQRRRTESARLLAHC